MCSRVTLHCPHPPTHCRRICRLPSFTSLCVLRVSQAAQLRPNHNALVRQSFETPLLPVGGVLQIVLTSTWGDRHYVGLGGLELYDAAGQLLHVRVGSHPPAALAVRPSPREGEEEEERVCASSK
jgi:hypothetical protein